MKEGSSVVSQVPEFNQMITWYGVSLESATSAKIISNQNRFELKFDRVSCEI